MDKRIAKPTLGDAVPELMGQWRASQSNTVPTESASDNDAAGPMRRKGLEETLRSWKRGGGEVKVRKGSSSWQEKQQRKSSMTAAGEEPSTCAYSPQPVDVPTSIQLSSAKNTMQTLRQRLSEASADVRDLRIATSMSISRGFEGRTPVVENTNGRLAILGLDFGTAFTKAIVRWSGRHYAVDWSDAVDGEDHHLLASVFSEAHDGRCVLGTEGLAGWSVHEGIKLKLLTSERPRIDAAMVDAVIFLALAFRYVNGWMRRTIFNFGENVRWRLHVGLPTKSWDSDDTTEKFKAVAQAARILACMSGPVTRIAATDALSMTDQVDRPTVDVFPEFACQLYSYLLSPERTEDLHALVDIGAGTLDVAFFNVFMKHGEALLPIFASEVDRLGTHYLLAAMSGAECRARWADGESSLSDEQASLKLGCMPSAIRSRRSLYLSSVAELFNEATVSARKLYPTSPAFKRAECVRLFLCGGGSRVPSLQQRFERIAEESALRMGVKFQVSKLVKPRDIVGKLETGFDRLSVAYGLSQNAANIGNVIRSATLDPVIPRERVTERHRDEDR